MNSQRLKEWAEKMSTFEPDPSDTRYKRDEDKRCKNCLALFEDHHNGECPKDEETNHE